MTAVDINTVANAVYAWNHPETTLKNRNIQRLSAKEINKMNVDTILMSPPCQPFTRVGNRKDMDDARSNALVALCELLPSLSTVQFILMENVKGFETSEMHDHYIESLESAGFDYQEFILSPYELGIPNVRQRYFCLARNTQPFSFQCDEILQRLPSDSSSSVDNATPASHTVADYLDADDVDKSGYLLSDDVLLRRSILMDIAHPTSEKTMCFTKAYTHYAEGTGSVFCPHDQIRLTETFDAIKTMPMDSPERLQLLQKLQLRYFTPAEISRLMCFPTQFSFPPSTTNRQRYRLLGNSINVLIVSKLINLLYS